MMSSTCFKSEGSSSERRLYVWVWYSTFYMHRCRQSCSWKRVFSTEVPYQIPRLQSWTHSSTYKTAHTLHVQHTMP